MEMGCRGRQGASKWLERMGLLPLQVPDLRENGAALLERFRGAAPRHFFDGAASEETPSLIAQYAPDAVDQAVAAAEVVCRRRFDLLGYRGLFFGDPMDWHLDPISGRRAPLVHWSRLDPLDPGAVGDMKVVWELNRHQWLVHLGQAYRATGDERYARMFAASVREWMEANPPGRGINWASSLEVALRLISWCWAVVLFRRSEALSPELFAGMVSGIWTHARHVERYLSYYFSPNTHLTGEALGLFYAGCLLPELRPAGRWRRLGARILVNAIDRQVAPDGVHFEQSTCYQRYTVEIYLHFLILAALNGVEVPKGVGDRVQQMLDFLLTIRRPDGWLPEIGDADGGSVPPLAARALEDVRGVFSAAAAFFGRSDYAWAAGGLAPEALWLLGPSAKETFETLRPAPPAGAPSRLFAHGGYAVMRSGWESDAHHLIFDVGPLGCPVSGAHGHADLLSIQCSAFGKPFLTDPGTYGYTAEPAWRDFFRGTAAHSTVLVDGVGQAIPAGPFRWQARPGARLTRWASTEAFDFADASHDAYSRLAEPVTHRRRVVFVKPRYWVLVDDLEGQGEHSVELRFQFGPMDVTVDPALWARACAAGGHGLLIRPFATAPLKGEIHDGEISPIQGWVSPAYGQRRPAPLLVYSAVARLPLRVLTLLLPVEDALAAPLAVSPLDEPAGPAGLLFEESRERVRFHEGGVVLERG